MNVNESAAAFDGAIAPATPAPALAPGTSDQGSPGRLDLHPAPPKQRGGMFGPLSNRNFALLFSGQLISALGDQVYGLALPWTVLAKTGDPRQMAIVLVASTAPRVLLLLVGGALADRLNPRVVMLAADLGRVAVVGVLGFTLFFGLPPLWLVSLLAGLEGAGSGLFGPGAAALTPRLLKDEQLQAGNGLFMVVQYGTLAIGPLLGGVATAAQATVAFLADAASFAVSALTLFAIRLPKRRTGSSVAGSGAAAAVSDPKPAPSSLWSEIGSGLRYAFGHPLIRATMFVTLFGNFGFGAVGNVGIIVLSRAISPSPITLGVLLAAIGVGGIVGGLSSALLSRLRRRGVVALVLFLVAALFFVLIPVVAGSAGNIPGASGLLPTVVLSTNTRIAVIAGLLGLIGLIVALGDTMILTVMQQRISPDFMSRVLSVGQLAGGIVQPLSLLVSGYLAALLGPGIVFAMGAIVLAVGVTLGLGSRELRHL